MKVVKPTDASRFPDVQVSGSEPPPEATASTPNESAADNYGTKDGVNPAEVSHERSGERNYLLQQQ